MSQVTEAHNTLLGYMHDKGDVGKLLISFRGQKLEFPAVPDLTIGQLKSYVSASIDDGIRLSPENIKLIFKGKLLCDDQERIVDVFGDKLAKVHRLMATGLSTYEQTANELGFEQGMLKNAPQIRDDLTDKGRQALTRRRIMGQKILQDAAARSRSNIIGGVYQQNYGFDTIETLPNLPDAARAREILTALSNDPGILACMAKHEWNVGCLAELYPEGKVGQSHVCVMGLNQNKGQKILLRVRTDDLLGFRKMLSIRKVLFHELAHNVHSDHNQEFFLLMRQIERECKDMNWTKGSDTSALMLQEGYVAGSYRLGGNAAESNIPVRDLTAKAAMQRLSDEEKEIYSNCGCGQESKFLPPSDDSSNS